ncbi:MAG: S8 family serine peptidase, partial [Caldilinea sp.]
MYHARTSSFLPAGWVSAALMVLLIGLTVAMLTFSVTQAAPAVEPIVASTEPYIEYVPNTLLLKLKPGVTLASGQANAAGASVASSAESLNTLLSTLGATSAQPVFGGGGTNAVQASRSSAVGLERVYRVQWTSSIPVEHAVAALTADVAVEYAEPDYVARPARIPDDPEYSSQWALARINAPAAWDAATGDPSVTIAFVDSGVDLTHPDFAGRLWVNDDPPNGIDDDLNGKVDDLNGWNVFANNNDIGDSNGHGSRVGGVAGAATNNGAGVAGMCWKCSLMFVNAMQANNVANYSDVAAAVQYAASNGAQVINLSLGGYADSAVLRDAVREAAVTALLVGGAGNDDSGAPFYPAAYPEVLAVAATDNTDQKALFSNYGAWVDVSAPGQDIRTTTAGGYATGSGTSLAAPFVSGLAGLIRSQQPAWTPEQVRWQILNTAVNIDGLNSARAGQLGQGRIDASAALATTPQARAAVESYAIDGQANARPAPGQAFQLALNVRNLWLSGQNLQGMLTSSDPYVTLTDTSGAFGDIAPGQLGSNSGDPFGVTISDSAPYNYVFSFTLNLSGAGGYSLAVPFTAQVRSAVETLGNTIYSANSTWTSDKIYVLNGTVIVDKGVALTIQPGTVIKANPGRFIRVDGTLIARGTAAQPILFTTNSITNAAWSGIRFADTAVDASYDAAGKYLAGSVLQFVEINSAELAVSLSTRAPYIADSTFRSNGTSIQIGNNQSGGSPRIERNEFWGNGNVETMPGYGDSAILLNGGQPLIQQNTLTGISIGISGSGSPSIWNNTLRSGGTAINLSGSPSILANVIQDNSGTAINLWQSWWSGGSSAPVLRNNVIVGNGGGVSAVGLQHVDIEHNLIANNGGSAAVTLDVQASNVSQSTPALAYHPGRDEYLAVWIELAASNAVKMLRLAADGAPLGAELLISTSSSGHAAQVVYQAAQDRYFVVWAGTNDVQGRFVTADGQISGDLLSVSAVSSPSAVRVSYLPAVDNFLVAYQYQENSPCCSTQKVAVQRLTAAGVPAGSAIEISLDTGMTGMNAYLGDLAVDASGKALVTLHSDLWGLYGAWIEAGVQSQTATLLAEYDTASYARRPAVAFGAGRYAVVWEQTRGWSEWSDPRFLLNLPVNSDGTLPFRPTLIFSDTGQAQSPRLVYGSTPNEFLVTWAYNPQPDTMPGMDSSVAYRLYAQRLSDSGGASGALIVVSSPQTTPSSGPLLGIGGPAIAYNSQRNEYLVAWSDNRTGVSSLWAQRLNAAGQLLDNGWTSADETNPANNFPISQPRG